MKANFHHLGFIVAIAMDPEEDETILSLGHMTCGVGKTESGGLGVNLILSPVDTRPLLDGKMGILSLPAPELSFLHELTSAHSKMFLSRVSTHSSLCSESNILKGLGQCHTRRAHALATFLRFLLQQSVLARVLLL